MKRFLFGMDQTNPEACAKLLSERGIEAVVCGRFTPEAVKALQAYGIDMYLSCGAYGVPQDSDRLAQDAFGTPRRWFNSGCPNDWQNADALLTAALECAAETPEVKGILVDGARFASFASVEGIEPFFSCFCPRCMQAMTDLGYDALAIRDAVGYLMQHRVPRKQDEPLLNEWLAFREQTVTRYFDTFAQRVHALRADLLAGAFIFAPSLGRFVGQTAASCRSLDVVSHMLYRDYHQQYGVACLGHEWAAHHEAFGGADAAFLKATASDSPFRVEKSPADLLATGFEPAWVGMEVAQARKELPDKLLWPILQSDDERVAETVAHAMQNGADAAGYFVWGHGEVPNV